MFSLLNPTPLSLRRAYNIDRPGKTDSPVTIDAGVFQMETDVFNVTEDRHNPPHKKIDVRTWLAGSTNFRIGLTNWMDLQIFPQDYINRHSSGSDFGSPQTQSGFGDTTIRLKINFIGNDGGKFILGFVSSLKTPTNTDQTGNHVFEPGFDLPINYSLPAGFTLFAQSRIDILNKDHSSGSRVQWSNPIGVSRTIIGNLSGYIEFYDAVSTGDGYPWIGTLDTGLIYQVTPDFSIDVSTFFGLTPSADDLNVFVGFGRRF